MKKTVENKIENLLRKAEKLIGACNYQDAELLLNQVLEENSDETEGHYLLGGVLCKQSKFSLAVDHLKKALYLSPGHPRVLHLLGWAIFLNGDPDSGRKLILQSVEKLPDAQAYCDLAVLENQQGNYDKAMEYALKTKEIEPENETVQEVIGVITFCRKLREQSLDSIH